MHPYEIAAVCRALLYVVACIAVTAYLWNKRPDAEHVVALTILFAGVLLATMSAAGVSRDFVGLISIPFAGAIVGYILLTVRR